MQSAACSGSYAEARDLSLYLEREDGGMRVILPVNIHPCVRASAQANAYSPPALPEACRICVPGILYVLQALHDLVQHRVALSVVAGRLHVAQWVLQSQASTSAGLRALRVHSAW